MAFKPMITAECDHCGEEIAVWAVDESAANRRFEDSGWWAFEDAHYCPQCSVSKETNND